MSADAQKDLFIVVIALWSIVQGSATPVLGIMASWPENFDPKCLHNYIHDKGYINSLMAGTSFAMLLILSLAPVIILTLVYPAFEFGEEYRDDIILTWKVSTTIGILLSITWIIWSRKKEDPIAKVIDRHQESLPMLIEFEDSRDSMQRFRDIAKSKEVNRLRHKFFRASMVGKNSDHILKRYNLEGERFPFVLFLDRAKSREIVDGQEIFHAKDISTPEKYATLLRKVLEKHGRPV